MNNNTLTNEILESIENIETVTMESEMNVLTSLCECYSKQCMIMEYCDDTSVFQESMLFMEDGEESSGVKKVLNKIGEWFKKMIRKISFKIMNFKFDVIVEKIKNAPEGSTYTIYNRIHEINYDEISSTFDDCLKKLDTFVSLIESKDTDISKYKSITTFKNGETMESMISSFKLLGMSEPRPSEKQIVNRDEMLKYAQEQKTKMDKWTPQIKLLIKNVDKLFGKGSLDFATNPELVEEIKKTSNNLVDCYMALSNSLLKLFTDFSRGVIQ